MIRENRERKLTGKSGLRKRGSQPRGWVFFWKGLANLITKICVMNLS
jgi:hypothetical protein